MHATETKHKLPALFWPQHSNKFLTLDRIIAYITGFYGIYLWYINPCKTLSQIIVPIIGGLCGVIGEHTENLLIYTITHTIWHFCGYVGLALVNH
jgi:hypothetical protein